MTDELDAAIPASDRLDAEYRAGDRGDRPRRPRPVPPDVLAQLLERPVGDIERWCELARRRVPAEGRGFELVKVAGGYRYQTPRRPVAYVERFLLDDQRARLSARRSRRWRSSPTSSRSRGPRSPSIRGVDPDGVLRTLQSRGYVDASRPRSAVPARRSCTAPPPSSSRRSASTRIADLPPIAEFVPGADVVEALEQGLASTSRCSCLTRHRRRRAPTRAAAVGAVGRRVGGDAAG